MFFKLVVLWTLVFGCSQVTVVNSRVPARLENFGLNGRIIQGQPAKPGQFPWQVYVNYIKDDKPYFCGGALISPDWVLTAAQCVYQASLFSIRLGALKSSGTDEASLQVIPGERAIYHPQYNPNTFSNDIALIKMTRKAELNQYVKAIRLADSADFLAPDTDVTVSGWGYTRTGGTTSPVLNYVNLRTISNEQCKNYYNIVINSTVCCKGNTIENICNGDGGSALVRYTNDVPVHVGIVSFLSLIGCEAGLPSGFVRTASFRDWIGQITGE